MEFINEPIIDKNGIIYDNILDYCIKTKSEFEEIFYGCTNFCKRYFEEYHFIHYERIKFRGECYPENSTIKDVIEGRAIEYVSL